MMCRFALMLLVVLAQGYSHFCWGQWDDDYVPLATKSARLDSTIQQLKAMQTKRMAGVDAKKQKLLFESLTERSKTTLNKLTEGHILTDEKTDLYLAALLSEICTHNPSLPQNDLRILLTRYPWPNASQVGEGTILLNIGLVAHLENESQLAFVLCHEIAHYALDHVNKAINKRIAVLESEATKKQLEEIEKTEYGARAKALALLKEISYDARRHSRSHEAQADSLALELLLNTRFNAAEALKCLGILDNIDAEDTTHLYLRSIFDSQDFPFNNGWLKLQQSAFGITEIKHEFEEDSLKTHPDCAQRIALLVPRLASYREKDGSQVSEVPFRHLQMVSLYEIPWSYYFFDDVGHCLYEATLRHAHQPRNSYFIGLIGMCINRIYHSQKTHELGKYAEMPDQELPPQYNLVLNFIQNLKLSEVAKLGYYFLQKQKDVHQGEFQLFAWWDSCGIMADSVGQNAAQANYLETFPQGRFTKDLQSK